jgi:biotin synthase
MNFDLPEIKDKVFSGQALSFEEALGVLSCPDEALAALYEVVGALRRKYRGRTVAIQVITSVKNGDCGEDCHYCAQSLTATTDLDKYSLLAEEALLRKARLGDQNKITRHCLGFSGLRFSDAEIETFCRQIALVRQESSTPICCSIGFLTRSQALRLKAAGVSRINHNLNTSARFYSSICSTHSFEERLENLRLFKSVGLEICCGGIVGMGEEPTDVVDMLLTLRDLEPASVPINFYVPISGTSLASRNPPQLSPKYCLKVLALARMILPQAEIRCAAGRERYLADQTDYVLAAADSIFANGYLTVDGLGLEPALAEIAKAGYTVVWG